MILFTCDICGHADNITNHVRIVQRIPTDDLYIQTIHRIDGLRHDWTLCDKCHDGLRTYISEAAKAASIKKL